MKILKYQIPAKQPIAGDAVAIIDAPKGSTVLKFASQHGKYVLWLLCPEDDWIEPLHVKLVLTGVEDNLNGFTHIGTEVLNDGHFVIHCFYRFPNRTA